MKKKFTAALLTLAALLASVPTTVFAANQTVSPADQDSFAVVASASVTQENLSDLGLNVVVSFPTELALTLDGMKAFSGSEKIYAYGIMDTGKTLSVSIDTTNEAYGKVKYHPTGSDTSSDSGTNFFSTVEESLSKESFTATETKDNYLAQMEGSEMSNFSLLSVSIKNLIPTMGSGVYYTNVPLKIAVR